MTEPELFPPVEPHRDGELRVSDLHTIRYQEVGPADGRPALYLHGGPGIGILPGYRRFFDPAFYRTVLPDQRGAGRSTPSAEIRENTTWDLVEDLERLRRHLGIRDWVVLGGSWGSTLALCYAIAHPESVAGLIVRGVFLGRAAEIAWLHGDAGAALVYPDEWEAFRAPVAHLPPAQTVAGYMALLTGPDEALRQSAAVSWSRWEMSMSTLVRDSAAIARLGDDPLTLAKARIECHYTHNGFFLESDDHILGNASRIAGIPCRIVQGRHDVICPTVSAFQLHRALPGSELVIVPDGAHSPMDPGMAAALVRATEDFKQRAL